MIKKVLASILTVAFTSVVFVGCGGSTPEQQAEATKKDRPSPMSRKLKEKFGGQQEEAPAAETETQEQQPQ
jgi:hypothetical protein